jgi:integrase
LKWFDVDLNRNVLHVRVSKSGRARTVPLNATVRSLLESIPKTSEYAFVSPMTGGRHRRWTAIRAGIEEGKDHGFSLSRSSSHCRNEDGRCGADAFTLAAILGHSDIRMTARYTRDG